MGGDTKASVQKMLQQGVDVRPVSIAHGMRFERLLDLPAASDLAKDPAPDKAWVNMYQRQDVSAVALFYLDSPQNGLAEIPSADRRREALPVP
jgi:stage III sporulation protein SpoIIIAA